MTVTTFDTLAYARKLKDAGIPEAQAEAQTAALAEALKQSAGELDTQTGLDRLGAELKQELRVQEERNDGRFRLLYWMLGFDLALTVAVLWILIRH